MARGSQSGSEPDRRDHSPDPSDHDIEGSETDDRANGADGSADPGDWIASVRDVDYTGNGSTERRGGQPARSSEDSTPSRRGDYDQFDVHWADGVDTDLSERDEWWEALPHDVSHTDTEDSPPLFTDTSGVVDAAPRIATRATTTIGATRAGKGSGRKALIVALAAVLALVVVAGIVIVTGRSAGHRSRSSAATPAPSVGATTTTPTSTASASSTPSATPARFTVQSTCAGRACSVAVRDAPNTAGKSAGSLRNGDVVQVSCSTKGQSIADKDSGQQSDVWYRLADGSGYASALYLTGPTVPSC